MHRAAYTAILPLIACILTACGASRSAQGDCGPAVLEPEWLAGGPVYRACDVQQPARLTSSVPRMDFRPLRPEPCVSVLLEFVVDATGAPEPGTVRIVRTTSSDFAQAAIAVVPALRYSPALRAGEPVRQIVQWGTWVSMTVTVAGQPSPPRRAPTTCRP